MLQSEEKKKLSLKRILTQALTINAGETLEIIILKFLTTELNIKGANNFPRRKWQSR